MAHTIELETIGQAKGWVAEITGKDPKFGFARKFLAGVRDYSRANRPRTRGVYCTYELEDGKTYEINDPQSWGRIERYFWRDGEKIDAVEVLAKLAMN